MDCSKALPAFAAALVILGAWVPVRLSAQDIALRRDVPQPVAPTCTDLRTAARAASPQNSDEATRLTAAAREAALLGDLRASRDLLARAAAADTSSAAISFLFARALDDLGETDAAASEYCRYLALAPDAPDVFEVRQRIERLPIAARAALPDSTVSRFVEALAHADQQRDRDADMLLSRVIAAAPSWPAPYLDRAIVRARNGRIVEARADFEEFLALAPGDADAPAVRAWLARSAVPARTQSAGTAFAVGLIPGGGYYYSGRPVAGTALLALAAGAVAFGALYEKQYVDCLSFPVNGACPADQVRGQRMERPYLLAGVGVAAAMTVFGAIDAARRVRSRNARAAAPLDGADAAVPQGAAGAIRVRSDRVEFEFLRIRF